MTTAVQPDLRVDGAIDLATEAPCVYCAPHLADAPLFDRIWSEEQQRWLPFCGCSLHGRAEDHDPARWLFIRHDHELIEAHPVRASSGSWPICDEYLKPWIRDEDEPHVGEARVLPR